jgi:hypothetical protein
MYLATNLGIEQPGEVTKLLDQNINTMAFITIAVALSSTPNCWASSMSLIAAVVGSGQSFT